MKKIFLTIILCMVVSVCFAGRDNPIPEGKGIYQELNDDGSISVGIDNETGSVDIKYKYPAVTPVFGIAGLHIRDYVEHWAFRDHTGASWIKRTNDQIVIGSFFGAYWNEGFNLSPFNYTDVKNYLYSDPNAGYEPISPYDYASDDLTLNRQLANWPDNATISIVTDSKQGTVFDYNLPYYSNTLAPTFEIDEFRHLTGLNNEAVGWVASAWIKFPATSVAVNGSTYTVESTLGIYVGVDISGGNFIGAQYDDAGDLEAIVALNVDNLMVVAETFTLEASPVADTWYHVSMVCDGTTGIDYRASDADGASLGTADEDDVAIFGVTEDFSDWLASFYSILSSSGYGIGVPAGGEPYSEGEIDSFRVDEFSFWTEKP